MSFSTLCLCGLTWSSLSPIDKTWWPSRRPPPPPERGAGHTSFPIDSVGSYLSWVKKDGQSTSQVALSSPQDCLDLVHSSLSQTHQFLEEHLRQAMRSMSTWNNKVTVHYPLGFLRLWDEGLVRAVVSTVVSTNHHPAFLSRDCDVSGLLTLLPKKKNCQPVSTERNVPCGH